MSFGKNDFELAKDKYGSFTVTEKDGNKLTFMGLSSDFDKLPTDNDVLATGSCAIAVDTGVCKLYHADTKTWYTA